MKTQGKSKNLKESERLWQNLKKSEGTCKNLKESAKIWGNLKESWENVTETERI